LYVLQVWLTNRYVAQFGLHVVGRSVEYSAAVLVTSIAQTALLFLLYRAMRSSNRGSLAFIVLAASAMSVASIVSVCPQFDAYAYAAYAKLGSLHAAYVHATPIHPAPGFETRIWLGLPPSVYGPLWVAYNLVTVGLAPNFPIAFLVMRLAGIALIGCAAYALRRLDANPGTLAVVALNPFLYFYFVIEMHNDLLAIVLILAGAAIARRNLLLGSIVAAGAGLVKITFVLFATLALDRSRLSPQRMLLGFTAIVTTVGVVSAVFGGLPYLDAMLHTGTMQFEAASDARMHVVFEASHVTLGLIAVAATACAFFANAFLPIAAFSFYGTGAVIYPWYLGWCVPYAARMPAFTGPFFATLPVIATFIDPQMTFYPAHGWLGTDVFDIVVIASTIAILIVGGRSPRPEAKTVVSG
jgi:hypothetical protein